MDQETKDILEQLDRIEDAEVAAVEAANVRHQRKSDLLCSLQGKVGKKFSRHGKVVTICQRGNTYFTKGGSAEKIPSLD